MTTIAERLAKISQDIVYEAFPSDVIYKAKATILDTLGCALGGLQGEPTKIMRAVVRQLGGTPECGACGAREQTSVRGAPWISGSAIRYLDYNDTLMSRDPSHPSGN